MFNLFSISASAYLMQIIQTSIMWWKICLICFPFQNVHVWCILHKSFLPILYTFCYLRVILSLESARIKTSSPNQTSIIWWKECLICFHIWCILQKSFFLSILNVWYLLCYCIRYLQDYYSPWGLLNIIKSSSQWQTSSASWKVCLSWFPFQYLWILYWCIV